MRSDRGWSSTWPWAVLATALLVACDDSSSGVEPVEDVPADALALADRSDFDRFKDNIRDLAAFGDRTQGSESNRLAGDWIQSRLEEWGYEVERHEFDVQLEPRDNIYATKVGTLRPDEMYIVSAHFDGRGGGGAADDDASGSSLVLEAARVFSAADVETDVSIRFVFWNAEEIGLVGSFAYVNDRFGLQGMEDPPGSGRFPEPTWLGIVQHDMILFDHGLPPRQLQVSAADIDVEYQVASTEATASFALAAELRDVNRAVALDYPAQLGDNMRSTDSWPFRNLTAAVSVRENRRVSEIGEGSNPHWHQPTDLFETYSDDDFRLGFDAVRTTVATIASLAGARIR